MERVDLADPATCEPNVPLACFDRTRDETPPTLCH
jgi:hypothetical protein